jgi:hypothetical protein
MDPAAGQRAPPFSRRSPHPLPPLIVARHEGYTHAPKVWPSCPFSAAPHTCGSMLTSSMMPIEYTASMSRRAWRRLYTAPGLVDSCRITMCFCVRPFLGSPLSRSRTRRFTCPQRPCQCIRAEVLSITNSGFEFFLGLEQVGGFLTTMRASWLVVRRGGEVQDREIAN